MQPSPTLTLHHGDMPPSLPFSLTPIAFTIVVLYAFHCGFRALRSLWRTWENDKKRVRRQAECRKSIEELIDRLRKNPLPTHEVERITGLSLEELRQELRSSKVTPLEALRAYQTKAVEAHKKTNCLVEVITEAEEWAAELEHAQGARDGLLYGVPISIKDGVGVKGYPSTMGLANLIDARSTEDCAVLKVLKSQGAVPFVRTNVPQMEMSYEPGNPINGSVFNPHNVRHGPGGSSSGEAALLAAGGSLLGVGSDIGGSIRVPAHFCGIYGLKPTVQRMSNLGAYEFLPPEQNLVEATFGPLARDVDSLAVVVKALWNEDNLARLDPKTVRIPFCDQVYEGKRKLRVGFYTKITTMGVLPVTPSCARAVHIAKTALEKIGHQLVPWCPDDVRVGEELAFTALESDGGELTDELLAGDRIHPTLDYLYQGHSTPRWVRWVIAKTCPFLAPDLAAKAASSLGLNTLEYFKTAARLEKYVQRIHDSWQSAGLDAVICPPFPFPAPPLGNADLCFEACGYSLVYNALNFPAGVIPMAEVTSEDLEKMRDYPSDTTARRAVKKAVEVSVGMPVGVMVVSQRYHDELCLRVMRELQPYSCGPTAISH